MNVSSNLASVTLARAILACMYDLATRRNAIRLVAQGRSLNSVSESTGISRSSIRSWLTRVEPLPRAGGPSCPRCESVPALPRQPGDYAYLLGLYLGDGCISKAARGVYVLRIACADDWPGLIEACATAIAAVRPENRVCRVQNQGCVMVVSYSKHWPCYFPQHGPGRKHERPIVLAPWQQEIVDAHPWELVRGLIHSDGCRLTNWATRMVGGERKRYEYPRYFFTNASVDILRIYTDALDSLGVEWTRTNARNVSVARRESVALLDSRIGPKY